MARILVFVPVYNAEKFIKSTLERIPSVVWQQIEELLVVDDASQDSSVESIFDFYRESCTKKKIKIHQNRTNLGYGGNQKFAYSYAVEKGFDYVIMLHGDGQYEPEILGKFTEKIKMMPSVVLGSRMVHPSQALQGGMPLYKWLGNQALTRIQNKLSGLKLSEFHSGYRMYSVAWLKRTHFFLNSDGFDFDTEILLQAKSQNSPIHEFAINTHYGEEICHVNGVLYAINALKHTVSYFFHRLGLSKAQKFQSDSDVEYREKKSSFSSHEIIKKIILSLPKATSILEMGAAQVSVLNELDHCPFIHAIDRQKPTHNKFSMFDQFNLESQALATLEKSYDLILMPDVIEHLSQPDTVLSDCVRILKPNGHFVISVPNVAHFTMRLSLLLGRFEYTQKGIMDKTHLRFFTKKTLLEIVKKSGFQIDGIQYTNIPFENIPLLRGGPNWLVALLDNIYRPLVMLFPKLFAYQFVILASPNVQKMLLKSALCAESKLNIGNDRLSQKSV